MQCTESHAHDERYCARNPLTAFGCARMLIHMLSQADRRSSYPFHTIDTTSPIFFQDPTGLYQSRIRPTPHTHPPRCCQVDQLPGVGALSAVVPIAADRSMSEGICGTGRPTGIQDPGKDWESRAARVMYFCTRLPKPNSYRSHQLSPEIPTPLAPAEASCLVLANGHRLAALRRRVEGPN